MDKPTYIIIFSLTVIILLFFFLKLFRVSRPRLKIILLLSFLFFWIFLIVSGEIIYNFTSNGICSKYLGCITGFLGYDAFEHFFFGAIVALAIIWLGGRFPKYYILHSERWKKVLIVIAITAFICILWEILECVHDVLRVNILHEPLYNISLQINLLNQPTNFDTMGDLSFGLTGSIIGFLLLF